MKKKIYYAHTMTTYYSQEETDAVELLKSMGYEVVNPSDKKIVEGFELFKKDNPSESSMDYFLGVVKTCDLLAFSAVEDDKLTSGVVKEVLYALGNKMPVLEIHTIDSLNPKRFMSLEKTREYLKKKQ